MIPEFVGRFPAVVSLQHLTKADLGRILTEVRNNYIDQYRWLFQQDGVDFTITDDAREALIDRAMSTGTGARALHSELERVLMPHMFELVQYRQLGIANLVIDRDLVNTPASLQGDKLEING
jgi:ATP-dependent Clp protease ATP-binding subunit ClpX